MWAVPTNGSMLVLAERSEWNASRDDELVVAAVVGERRQVERPGAHQLAQGGRHPFRSACQGLAVEVDAQGLQQDARSGRCTFEVRFRDGAGPRPCARAMVLRGCGLWPEE